MKRRKQRNSSPAERVQAAKSTTTKSIDFEYDETTDVLRATLDVIRSDNAKQQDRVTAVARRLHSIAPGATDLKAKTG